MPHQMAVGLKLAFNEIEKFIKFFFFLSLKEVNDTPSSIFSTNLGYCEFRVSLV